MQGRYSIPAGALASTLSTPAGAVLLARALERLSTHLLASSPIRLRVSTSLFLARAGERIIFGNILKHARGAKPLCWERLS